MFFVIIFFSKIKNPYFLNYDSLFLIKNYEIVCPPFIETVLVKLHREVFFWILEEKKCTVVVKKTVSKNSPQLSETKTLVIFFANTTSHRDFFFSKLKKKIHGKIFQVFDFFFPIRILRFLGRLKSKSLEKKPTIFFL